MKYQVKVANTKDNTEELVETNKPLTKESAQALVDNLNIALSSNFVASVVIESTDALPV